jgi:hypothetical protein
VQDACDCYSHVEYRTDPRDGRWQFAWRSYPGAPPRDLVCSTVRIRDVNTPRDGRFLYQTPDRTNWGGWLKPGFYRSLDSEDVRQSCVLIGPTQADGLGVIGGNGDTVNVTGVKANVPVPPTLKLPRSSWFRNLLLIQGFLIAAAAITVAVLVIVLQQRARVRS